MRCLFTLAVPNEKVLGGMLSGNADELFAECCTDDLCTEQACAFKATTADQHHVATRCGDSGRSAPLAVTAQLPQLPFALAGSPALNRCVPCRQCKTAVQQCAPLQELDTTGQARVCTCRQLLATLCLRAG